MRLHYEILDAKRKEVWQKLAQFKDIGYLAGGTALALQIGHRVSYDFDVFCPKPITAPLTRKIMRALPVKKILLNNGDEFTFLTLADIKVSFVYYPFDLSAQLKRETKALPLLSTQGVAITKAYALNRRNSWRDYVDLYFVIRDKHASLKQIIAAAGKVYGGAFSEKLFLAQLLYTDDIALSEIKNSTLLEKIDPPAGGQKSLAAIKRFLQTAVKNYVKTDY